MSLWRLQLSCRRWLVLFLTLLFTSLASGFFFQRRFGTQLDAVDLFASILFVIIMLAGSFNFWLYVFGFFLWKSDRNSVAGELYELRRIGNGIGPVRPIPSPSGWQSENEINTRTAIVMPVYHEEMEEVYDRIRQTWRSIEKVGLAQQCDFYLLCDSTDPAVRDEEELTLEKLVVEFGSTTFALVRRRQRKKYKAGNIANFLIKYGKQYDFMLVLDADSVMLGCAIKRLILRMQADSELAIAQTMVVPIRAATPFARMMQFGCSRTIPIYAIGQQWFFGSESVYWGHNALIRIAPFMEHCNLPLMPGKPPLGGEIMSQDIVEAALLARAGWKVKWDLDGGGSFDEMPANILSYGKRDRRWCQGNFQHFWLIFGDRMKLGHRIYFANGIFAYAGSPLLLLLTLLAFVQGLRGRDYRVELLMLGWFLGFFLTMLVLPKIFGFMRQLKRGVEWRKELASTFLEVLMSALVSPSLFYLHSRFVLEILLKRVVPWRNQQRNPNEALSWRAATRVFWLPTIISVIWLLLAIEKTPGFLPYLVPILIGGILSIPVAVWTSNPVLGKYLASRGLLLEDLSSEEIEVLDPLYRVDSGSNPAADLMVIRRDQPAQCSGPALGVVGHSHRNASI